MLRGKPVVGSWLPCRPYSQGGRGGLRPMTARAGMAGDWLPIPPRQGLRVLAGLGVLVLVYPGRFPDLWPDWIRAHRCWFIGRRRRPRAISILLRRGPRRCLRGAWSRRSTMPWGRYVYPGPWCHLLSSYYYLKQAEAITLYSSGQLIALGDIDTGVEQLRRAIDQGPCDRPAGCLRAHLLPHGERGGGDQPRRALAAFDKPSTDYLQLGLPEADSLLSKGAGEHSMSSKPRNPGIDRGGGRGACRPDRRGCHRRPAGDRGLLSQHRPEPHGFGDLGEPG